MRIKISLTEIHTLGHYIKEKTGIVLDEKKAYLFESRLSPLLTELNCSSYTNLLDLAKKDHLISTKLMDSVCTNETSFFRDKSPFSLMIQKLAPDFFEKNPIKTLNVLSAACSTGQEVYSLIMALTDAGITAPRFKINFTAIDISDKAITKASRGEYSKFELARGMNSEKLSKFFDKNGELWRIKDKFRSIVRFKKSNLLKSNELTRLGKFDIIFCRNVAIYFSKDDKQKVFDTLATMINPNGHLLIGSTESLVGISNQYTRNTFHGAIYYDKN